MTGPSLMSPSLGCLMVLVWVLGLSAPVFGADAPDPNQGVSTSAAPTSDGLTDIHDIKPPEPAGFNSDVWRYAIVALAAALIILALWMLIRRYRRKQMPTSVPVVPTPPEQIAMNRLDQLARLMGSDGRGYYFELSALFREYLQGRFDLNAPEMTTEELLPRVTALGLEQGLQGGVKTLLETSDPVKFAATPTQMRFMQRDLEFVKGFVLRTTPDSDDNPGTTGQE